MTAAGMRARWTAGIAKDGPGAVEQLVEAAQEEADAPGQARAA